MPDGMIELKPDELKALKESMGSLKNKIQQFSSGNYISKNVFNNSQGSSVDVINEILSLEAACAQQMEAIILNTEMYFNEILIGFMQTDQTQAEGMTLGG